MTPQFPQCSNGFILGGFHFFGSFRGSGNSAKDGTVGYSLTIATAAQAGETEAAFEGFGWVLVFRVFGLMMRFLCLGFWALGFWCWAFGLMRRFLCLGFWVSGFWVNEEVFVNPNLYNQDSMTIIGS